MISFCCLSYNHGKYIEECIRSIWNQNLSDVEILALDDGSSDNSVEVLNKLKEISPCPMTVISQANSGCIGKNFNKLINLAQGEYVAVIACDDNFIENTIKEKLELFNQDKDLVFVCNSRIRAVNEFGEEIKDYPKMKLDEIENPTPNDLLKLEFQEIHSYYIQGAIYKKSIIEKVNGFDDDMICDDIILRTKISKYLLKHPELKFIVLHKNGVNYRRHSSNVSNNSIRQIEGVLEYFVKYQNKISPALLNWAYSAIREDSSKKQSVINIFKKHKKEKIISEVINYGYIYKQFGIPFIFQIKKYKNAEGKRTKILTVFGMRIKI
ncbi:MAG: glycosyltransferase family 2 protein [bacterium]|nr:glycosyltransferase family 2 protein [bacterium]